MKKFLYILVVILLISACSQPTEEKSNQDLTDQQAVEQVEQLVQEVFDSIWSAMDTSAVRKYHTADFLLLEHGEVWNNDTIIDWANQARKNNQGTTRINEFQRIDYKRNQDKLWLAYHNYATIKFDTVQRDYEWLESVVAVRKDSLWKLELMHSTRVNRN